MTNSTDFIYPRSRYYGQETSEKLAFNANLQNFAQRVSIICCLETSGKISPNDAYQQIESLWLQLQSTVEQVLQEYASL